MKTTLSILLILAITAQAGDFKFYYQGRQSESPGVATLRLYPLDKYGVLNGTNVATTDPVMVKTDTNGYALVTNVVSGSYRSEFYGKFKSTTNWYTFPDTNGVLLSSYFITDNPTNGTVLFLDDGTSQGGRFLLDP